MAALINLEAALSAERLKTHWRPWAWPVPFPAHSHTLASVWLRLEALKTAVSLKVLLNLGGRALGIGAGLRYPSRDQPKQEEAGPRGSKKRGAPPSRADSGGTSSGGDGARAGRLAKRSRQGAGSGEESGDEAVARRLQSELNSGARATRSRLQNVFTAGRGEERARGGTYALREGATRHAYEDGSGSEEEWEQWEEAYVAEEEEEDEEEEGEEEEEGRNDSEEEYNAEGDSGED